MLRQSRRELFLAFYLALTISPVILQDDGGSNMLGFCDGEYYIPKSQASCPYGYNFGERVPKCMCIKGIYRMYMENCDQGIGFATSVCTRTVDEATGLKIRSLKLTSTANFDDVGLVYLKASGLQTEWEFMGKASKSDNIAGERFYVIRGIPKISVSKSLSGTRKQTICIEKDPNPKENFICMYRHTDNVQNWHLEKLFPYGTPAQVKDKCPGNNLKPLHAGKCFRPLGILDSDCQVPCMKTNLMGGDAMLGERLEPPFDMESGNCTTNPLAFFVHENSFIDRQLQTYLIVDKTSTEGNITIPEPDPEKFPGLTKVYELFDMIKDIAKRSCSCPNHKPEIWELAAKFFMYIHKSSKLQYEIPMNETHFDWIKDILGRCGENLTTLTLTDNLKGPGCNMNPRMTGFCDLDENGTEYRTCQYVPVKLSPRYQNFLNKHYVPEFVWLFLDIVHVVCFKEFNDSYRMFHIMEQAYEKLFSVPIRDYWHYPVWSQETKTWLLTAKADDIMWNAELCAASHYNHNGNKVYRLVRPGVSRYNGRRKRAAEPISTSFDVGCATKKNDFKLPEICKRPPTPTKEYLMAGGAIRE